MKNYLSKTLWTFLCLCIISTVHAQVILTEQEAENESLNFIQSNYESFGLIKSDVEFIRLLNNYHDAYTGLHHVYAQQEYDNIRVEQAYTSIHFDQNAMITHTNMNFVASLESKIIPVTDTITHRQALGFVETLLDLTFPVVDPVLGTGNQTGKLVFNTVPVSLEPVTTELVYIVVSNTEVRLAYSVEVYMADATAYYDIMVDAESGDILDQKNLVVSCSFNHHNDAKPCTHDHGAIQTEKLYDSPSALMAANDYKVFAIPAESPNHGPHIIVNSPWDLSASPFGWHDTNGASGSEFTITRGNNVHAYQDSNNSGSSSGDEPDGGPTLDFNFTYTYPADPAVNQDASVTNLFYGNNVIHDIAYLFGFREVNGNFQVNNYGNGGIGNDDVRAEAMDGGGLNNANMFTPAEGSRPRMQMYLWSTASPYLDGDFDNGIVFHEYAHGISNRLTGGPSTAGCLGNTEQMGEGWSDYFGLILTMETGDTGPDGRGIGTFALDQSTNGPGIRPARYSTDLSVNAYTYGDIGSLSIPHGVGFVWASMLWEMTWGLIDVYGFDQDLYNNPNSGNAIALQLIMEGMKLQPCNPGFVDGRDAILSADQLLYGGVNECVIWEAFAKRGLGAGASQGSSNNVNDGVEDFSIGTACSCDIPAVACIDATIDLGASGTTVVDPTIFVDPTEVLCGNVTSDLNSVDCDDVGSVLTVLVTATLQNSSATCSAQLTVEDNSGPELDCENITIDISGGPVTIIPEDLYSTQEYSVGSAGAFLPIDISATGINLPLSDDQVSPLVNIGFDFDFYENTYSDLYVSSNGFISFGSLTNSGCCSGGVLPTDDPINNLIAFAWEDLDPGNGGQPVNNVVRYSTVGSAPNRIFVLEFFNVDHWPSGNLYTGQLHLFESTNRIEIHTTSQPDPFGLHTMGVENIDGTAATTFPARNSQQWTATNEYAVFEPILGPVDNCGVASVTLSEDTFTCADLGFVDVVITVFDINGNSSECISQVEVIGSGTGVVEAVCQDISVNLDAVGSAIILAEDLDGGSTAECGNLVLAASQTTFTCDNLGIIAVELTASDDSGTTDICISNVTVLDTIAPVVSCLDFSVGLDDLGQAEISVTDILDSSSDNCSVVASSLDNSTFECSDLGPQTVTLTIQDGSGNIGQCSSIVDVMDNIAPTIVCEDLVINLDPGLCGQIIQFNIEASDNCAVTSENQTAGPETQSYLDYHDSPWTVSVSATDASGNIGTCDFSITMNEYANPTETLACNDLVTIAIDEDGCSIVGADMILEGGPYGCYDDYIVDIEQAGNEVCCETIGSTLTVVVTDPDTGNTCMGSIQTIDALAPYCESIADYTIDCSESVPSADDASHPGYPQFYDNCGVESISLVAQTTTDGDICTSGGITIEREWTAIDVNGNAASSNCIQTITIERAPLTLPASAEYDCAQYDLEDLVPALTGEPTGVSDGCMYNYAYADVVLPSCGTTSKITRTWTILDMCTNEVTTHVQIIELTDKTGPTVDASDMAMGTDSDQCASTGWVSLAGVTDDCSGVASVSAFAGSVGELEYTYDGSGAVTGGYIPAPGLELGDHDLTITATDGCGNYSSIVVTISVSDDVTPTPVCDEITQVALQSDGIAEVFAETFDDGSHDNCCLDGFDVRRMDGAAFGASVSFDCADADQTIQVILRVHDCHGNTNTCMVEVLVEDKIAPYLAVPAGTDMSCEAYYSDVAAELDNGNGAILDDMFGVATFGDNCEAILDYSYTYEVDQCGEGSITRSWTVNDPSGNGPVSGSQTITIYHVSDWSISFPGDLEATCVDGELPDFGQPTVSGDDCEMIAVSHTDTQYDVVPDACYKIVREWSAINWCTYPEEAAVTATQVIKVTDDEAPIFDVEDFTVEITEADCDVAVTLPTPDVTDCSEDITIETSSDLPAGEAGPGTYTATYTVSDGCGNYSYDVITITVVDAKDPTPYVTDHIVTEIMQTGMTQVINVNDYDIGSFDNCSDVVLSFSPDVTDTDVQFTCDDEGENTLEIWVTDEAGNQDFVTVTMEVQDNMNVCGPGSLTVAGALSTQDEEGIEDATVDINGGLFSQTTDATGTYDFDLETGADYSVVPSLDLDASNGVTTYDIVLITQHILGINPFDSPYELIAADANKSNSISTLDVVAIRMVILQMTDAFPNNTSWRFVDTDHVFTDPINPWVFPEVVNINNLDQEMLDVDFTGIKIGDVNGSAQANFMSPAEARNGNSFELRTMDKQVSAGDEVRITLNSDATVSGMQFTLEHNGLEYKGMEAGLMGEEHIANHESALTLSWNAFELKDLNGEDLVTLIFEAKGTVQLSESMVITSSMTKAEGYTEQGIEGVALMFDTNKGLANVLYQNTPNPFSNQTVVSFNLKQSGKAQILITDVDGKLIQEIGGTFPQGLNSVELDRINIPGIYYYQLNTEGYTAVKKMIKI